MLTLGHHWLTSNCFGINCYWSKRICTPFKKKSVNRTRRNIESWVTYKYTSQSLIYLRFICIEPAKQDTHRSQMSCQSVATSHCVRRFFLMTFQNVMNHKTKTTSCTKFCQCGILFAKIALHSTRNRTFNRWADHPHKYTIQNYAAWKESVFGVFLVRIFSTVVFSPNAGK